MRALTRLVSFGFMFVAVDFVRTVSFKKFTSLESFNNKICRPKDRISTVSVSSNADNQQGQTVCITHCISNHLCRSIFYNPVDLTCTICSGIYDVTSVLDDSTGSKYIVSNSRSYQENCTYPNDHCIEPNQECFADTCICSPGYSYNPSNDTCVDTCTSYGTTFQLYPYHRINKNNAYTRNGISVEECTDECLSDYLCASFDYNEAVAKCHIQYVNIRTAMTSFAEGSNHVLHVRDCA